jgi:hypothetical protein
VEEYQVFDAGGTQGSQPPVSQQAPLTTEQRIQNWIELVEQNAPAEQIQKAEADVAEALQRQPFEIRKQLPLFQKMAKKALHAGRAFQQFRLPGRDRVVIDRREQFQGEPKEAAKEAGKEAAKEAAKKATLTMKEGKLVEAKERSYAASAALGARGTGASDQRAAEARVDKMLSAFEKMVVERFEGGRQIAEESVDGMARYKGKTDAQWKEFFQKFLHRTVAKKTLLKDIKQFFMRGVVAKGGKGVFIGDMAMNSGRVEKFVRFSILAEALAKMRAMIPGDKVTAQMLGKLTGEELMYLALAASKGREFAYAQAAARGKFAGAKAEAQAAEALGIPLKAQLEQKTKQLRGKKGRGGLAWFEKDAALEDTPYRFVPWYSLTNLKNPGPTKWVTRVFYGALFIISMIGIIVLTFRLLAGG